MNKTLCTLLVAMFTVIGASAAKPAFISWFAKEANVQTALKAALTDADTRPSDKAAYAIALRLDTNNTQPTFQELVNIALTYLQYKDALENHAVAVRLIVMGCYARGAAGTALANSFEKELLDIYESQSDLARRADPLYFVRYLLPRLNVYKANPSRFMPLVFEQAKSCIRGKNASYATALVEQYVGLCVEEADQEAVVKNLKLLYRLALMQVATQDAFKPVVVQLTLALKGFGVTV